jgi:hypothetical protein
VQGRLPLEQAFLPAAPQQIAQPEQAEVVQQQLA